MREIVGRKKEIKLLKGTLLSDRSELVVVYGRRRVGKTFLLRKTFEKQIEFEITGMFEGNLADQLENFTNEIRVRTNKPETKRPKKWIEAFVLLQHYIEQLPKRGKKVIFIDEFPWIATQRSKFLMAFENFWNSYATKRDDLIVVICGSAASYMVQKIIKNRGGLHNRISTKIRLQPFTLGETQQFLKSRNINYTQYDILQLYMAIGGIPHYLEHVQRGLSIAQNIDQLCFEKNGPLNDEFNQLFASLFDNSERHIIIIKALAKVRQGVTRKKLIDSTKITSGGDFSRKLAELIESGFISESTYYQKKTKQTLYRLSDEYTLFYLKFIEPNKHTGPGTWTNLFTSQSYTSWSGFSFETICLKHIQNIKKGLKIEGIMSSNNSWFNENAQIDLLIDREDRVINLCEIKFTQAPFEITKSYHKNLLNKINAFKLDTETNKNIFLTMLTTAGIKQNKYSLEIVESELTSACLFKD
ncbi:MAG: AAA family ATPase [Crocinitomix sp.]|nr:AAA family ATPase [Crocinitomix sp.]